ncbi:MAG TPA: sigma-70 family RNA polymerase sigma factor [Humisphaera sp.]|jgi:RNA polymerase sigma-70 factor (ECF subfamily)|nr:sigma-70 family RNA polymerase sigma factor [Humisphaera sp.]
MADLDLITRNVLARSGALVLYARQWLDAAAAEDVVQEALTALLALRAAPDDPVAWMCRAVRNAAIDSARSSSRRRRREEVVAAERREMFESRPDSLIDARTAAEVLERLPADLREIVVLRIWAGMTLSQIAAICGVGITTVHDRYESALRQMRAALEKPCNKNP